MPYTTRTNLDIVFGKSNIDKWADANNNGNATQIAARVAWAIAKADAHINDRLRSRGYTLPFDPVPNAIEEISNALAGCNLYGKPRGLVDGDAATEMLFAAKEEAENELTNIASGLKRLDATYASVSKPFVVPSSDWD